MNAGALKVYEIFKENLKLGEEKASMVIKYLENSTEEKIKAEIKHKITHLATKEDISILKDNITAVREDMLKSESSLREEILKSESSLREEILKSESSLKEDIQKLHASTIKWMFIFWVGAVATIISVMKFL